MSGGETSLLAGLEALREEDPRSRTAAAWRLLAGAPGAEEFHVALDYAIERGLVSMEFAAAVKGQSADEGRAASWVNPIDGSEMIWIAPGPFFAGPKNLPARSEGFFLARHPVTNAQFERFLGETGYRPPPADPDPEWFLTHWSAGRIPSGFEAHPVVWVSLIDAIHYCRWAGLTLPDEWLWEKAARGPDGRAYPWGDGPPTGSYPQPYRLANVRAADTCPVGSFARTRSPYGCEDMVGNVSEWCRPSVSETPGDFPVPSPQIAPELALGTLAPVRGSCFLRQETKRMPAWHRRRLSATRRNRWVGFRPAFLPYPPPVPRS